jgi:formylglycine-generating enzyme required for sulfatase activity/serine/threonine protein kinase
MPDDSASFSETPPPRTTGGNWRWEPPSAAELQKLMPGYTIEKLLGRGGMGAVYRGVQTNLDRPVAIKILPPGVEKEDPSFAERFRSEAKLMARLNHPAVVSVYDFGTTSAGQLYFAMEYVDGSDVQQMIQAQGRLPPDHALAITAHVCDALGAAHELGIVHRDIKPANVLLNMKGQVKVADFGLAKIEDPGQHGMTKTGYAMGTPDFVAPEALMLGTAIDGRADLYAVGVMLYQMLTGAVPRGAFKPAAVMVRGLDPRFDAIILRAMQNDREERYQSSAELRRDLDVILTVPLVRQDAPSTSAIPVAQMAQAPVQRTAAPKPVAKAPQLRHEGSVGTPARKDPSQADRNAREHLPPAKSKAPLFLGLGAAAGIGIGAFVMFSGGKTAAPKPPPATIADSTPSKPSPVKPTATVKSEPTQKAAPKPTATAPSVASSPSLPVSKSSDKFPPGQWVKLFTKAEDLPEDLRKAGVKFEDGWIRFGGVKRYLRVPSVLAGNYGIRLTFIRQAETNDTTQGPAGISARLQPGDADGYNAVRQGGVYVCNLRVGGRDTRILGQPYPGIPPKGAQGSIELAVIGNRLVGRAGDHLVAWLTNDRWREGAAKISGSEDIRDIEVINLDGLSEAEALRILGVDEKGNDLRASAIAASPPPPLPAPSSNASHSDAGGAKSSDPKFPPGQWVKLFTKAEDLPEDLRKAGAKFEDGWIRLPEKPRRIYAAAGLTNFGLRARVLRSATATKSTTVFVRGGPYPSAAGYVLTFGKGVLYGGVRLESAPTGEPRWSVPEVLQSKMGDECTLEWSCVGNKLVGRVDEQFVRMFADNTFPAGVGFFTGNADLRDIEVINLDGLSEAEALRILGVDEKGNDLRPQIAQQEQQQMDQSKQADALAAIPELKALHDQFLKLQTERVAAPFEAEVAKLNTGYGGGIDRYIADAKKAGHLDGVLALEAEKQLLADRQPVPSADNEDTTAVLKKLRAIYREAYAKIEATRVTNLKALTDPLDARLKQMEIDFTKTDRLADAKTVRGYREALAESSIANGPPSAISPTAIAGASVSPKPSAALNSAALLAAKDGFTNTLGMKFLPVKGTDVLFGIHEVRYKDYAAYAAESPGVDGSWKNQTIDGYAITERNEDHPVMKASWEDAQAFCAWLSKKEGKLYRLPTDEEWSYAVGIGREEKRKNGMLPFQVLPVPDAFPWGGDFPPKTKDRAGNYSDASRKAKAPRPDGKEDHIESYDDGYPTTAPVMSFKPTKQGLYDLGGNVWEWCEDWYDAAQKDRVLRGCSWGYYGRGDLRSSYRRHDVPGNRNSIYGFRCVLVPGGAPPAVQAPSAPPKPSPALNPAALLAAKDGFTNTLGMKFLPVKGTEVLFGIHEVRYKDYAAYAAESPGVDGAWKNQTIDGYAITERNEDHPVTIVSWEDAQAFCAWLSKKEGKLYRLPTDEEWSWAVGLGREEKRKKGMTPATVMQVPDAYPWDGDYPPKTKDKSGNYSDASRKAKAPRRDGEKEDIENYDDGYPTTAPVMSFKPNKLGLYDLGGNVWEWCEDWYDAAQKDRVLRGGAWNGHDRSHLLSSYRGHGAPGNRNHYVGFRCVLVPGSTPVAVQAPTAPPKPSAAVNPPALLAAKDGFTNTLGMKFLPVKDIGVLFCIHEVRYQDYAAFVAETPGAAPNWKNQTYDGFAITERAAEHPVTQVNWEDAQAFCAWLSKKEGKLYRLPTDEEWSYAVDIGRDEKRKKGALPAQVLQVPNEFPWGGDFPPKTRDHAGNYSDENRKAKAPRGGEQYFENYDDDHPTTAPVMSYKPNKLGLYDLGGNVWEWCEDWYDSAQKDRVLRGGSWSNGDRGSLLSSSRFHNTPGHRYFNRGFRLVAVPGGSPKTD